MYLASTLPLTAQVQTGWVAEYRSPGPVYNDTAYDLKVDNAGNVYVTGQSYGNRGYDFATVKYSPNGQQVWANRYGEDGFNESAQRLAIDSSGNVFVTGTFTTPIDATKIATVKYSNNGDALWDRILNPMDTTDAFPIGVAVDFQGNVIVVGGSTRGTNGPYQFLTVRYDTFGQQLWTAEYSVSADSNDTPTGLGIDAMGNIYVVGRSSPPNELIQLLLVKYNSNGQLLWAVRYNGPADRGAIAGPLALDNSGHVYVSGSGQFDATHFGEFVAKYDSNGERLWVSSYGAPSPIGNFGAYPSSIAVDPAGNVFVGGSIGAYPTDYCTVKFDSGGGFLWAARYGGSGQGNDVLRSLALDTNGNVYVTGTAWSGDTYDDFATVKYDSNGNQLWVAVYASTNANGVDEGFTVALDRAGNVFVTGGGGANQLSEFTTVKYTQQTPIPGEPMITNPPRGQLIGIAGGLVSFSVTANGNAPLFYQWRQNGIAMPGRTNATLQVLANPTDLEADYSVEVRNAVGVTVSPEARLSVVSFPEILSAPVSRGSGPGTDVQFDVSVRGFPLPSYQWFFNGAPLPGATNSPLIVPAVQASNGGDYYLVISNYLGKATSTVATLTVPPAGPLDTWQWRNPLPQGNGLAAVAYGNGLFVGVGDGGAIVTSSDGATWSVQSSGIESWLTAVAFGNGRFVAAGGPGVVVTSEDGTNWVRQPFPVGTYPNAIAFGNDRFVVGSYSFLFMSTDGEHWTGPTSLSSAAIYSLAYGNGLFVGVGANNAIFTSTDGISWNNQSPGFIPVMQLMGVTYGNNRFVAVGYADTANSIDGTNWTRVPHGTATTLFSVAYGNGQYVGVGSNGGAKSADGASWTQMTLLNSLRGITFGNGLFAGVGQNGVISTSSDTVSWSNHSRGQIDNLHAVACGRGISVAVGNKGTILTSLDGLTWVRAASGVTVDLYGLTFANSIFYAVGDGGALLASTNGADWSFRSSGTSSRLHDVAWAGGRYIAVGRDGTTASSLDGVTWTPHYLATNLYLRGIAYGNGRYVAAGGRGQFFISTDATNWTQVDSGIVWDLNDVTFGDGLFVAISDIGFVLTSSDGTRWTTNDLQLDENLRTVSFANGLYIAAGNVGNLLSSPDGVAWTRHRTGFSDNFRGMCYAEGGFTLVGNNTTILQSGSFVPAQLAVRGRPTTTGFELTIQGETGRTYRLQTSSDLVHWIDLFTFSNSEYSTSYLETHAPGLQSRFYRAVSP